MTNSVNSDQTAPIGAVCSGSTLFASTTKAQTSLLRNNTTSQNKAVGGGTAMTTF